MNQVRIRIGSPITGYGQESRNRAARQRIPHRVWTDEDGVEHIEVTQNYEKIRSFGYILPFVSMKIDVESFQIMNFNGHY